MAVEPVTGSGSAPHPIRKLPLQQLKRLRPIVESIETLADARGRDSVVQDLRNELGSIFKLPRSDSPAPSAWEIVLHCLELGHMRTLVDSLELEQAPEDQLGALRQLIDELLPQSILHALNLQQIKDLLAEVPSEAVQHALTSMRSFAENVEFDSSVNGVEFFELIASATGQPDNEQIILGYLEAVSHRTDGNTNIELHLITHEAARSLGKTLLAREICERTRKYITDYGAAGEQIGPGGTRDDNADIVTKATIGTGDGVITIATATVISSSLPAVYGGVPTQNHLFVGRTSVLEDLRRALRSNARTALLPHTLHGLGGVGKSQVAIEYAHRFKSDYDLVWWIPADDERSIRRSLASLANRLGLPESSDVQQMIEAARDELRLGKRYPRWLLVFDNAAEPDKVRPYFPAGSGHVLITSRNSSWVGRSTVVEVDVFSEDECVEYLTSRWEDLTQAQALTLAEMLGRLPIALDQVASVHQQTGKQFDTMLAQLREDPALLLAEPPTEYPISVALSWRLAFNELKERNLAAAQLLQLCAFLSSYPIYTPMLWRQGRGAALPSPLDETMRNEDSFRNAVRDIGKYALAQLDFKRDFLTVHTLVRAVLRADLSDGERELIKHSAHEVLALANPGQPDNIDTWALHAHVAPHVLPSGVMLSQAPHVRQIVLDQIRYYFAIGDYKESRSLATSAVKAWTKLLGSSHEMTLLASFNLGNAQRVLGDYAEARRITEDTAERIAATLGEEHVSSLRVANSVTSDLRIAGDFAEAMRLDELNLERHERVLGKSDAATLRAANNLAVDHRVLGNFSTAREIDQRTYDLRGTILGQDNPETLASINALTRDIYGQGLYGEAIRFLQAKLPPFENALRSGHRFLLTAQRNRAVLWRKLGNYGEALQEAEENLQATRAQYGDEHEFTLGAAMTLSNTMRVLGDSERARDLCEQTLNGYSNRFGPTHPFTLGCAVNLGIAYRATGEHAKAMAHDAQTMHELTKKLGEDHPYTVCAATGMASNLAQDGQLTAAHALSEQVVERSLRIRPENHPYTLACQANLALDLKAIGRHEESVALERASDGGAAAGSSRP